MTDIQINGHLHGFQMLADGGLKVVFMTQEPRPDQVAGVATFHRKACRLVLVANDAQEVAVDAIPAPTPVQGKSKSQRMRAALYRVWESYGRQGDFEDFYKVEMEKRIADIKALILP